MNPLYPIATGPHHLIGGAFELADSYGFPLADSIRAAQQHGHYISLFDYSQKALNHGWTLSQILTKIKEALFDLGRSNDYPEIERKLCILHITQSSPNATKLNSSME